eukprot:CAMPEP_0184656414 /NCGR_PEP_ID=MMETSP0308-20130426/16487_1 /TAXON_ID=38269 /ORGANISM="Gloeochaete witrockiana, Strain SAG 46.84" /LENGTH=110 /DNA_ID=CAMNT_0027093535 /DNA_START=174 /DNA_END=503 /DNA_ORIENTATION=+
MALPISLPAPHPMGPSFSDRSPIFSHPDIFSQSSGKNARRCPFLAAIGVEHGDQLLATASVEVKPVPAGAVAVPNMQPLAKRMFDQLTRALFKISPVPGKCFKCFGSGHW